MQHKIEGGGFNFFLHCSQTVVDINKLLLRCCCYSCIFVVVIGRTVGHCCVSLVQFAKEIFILHMRRQTSAFNVAKLKPTRSDQEV